MFGTRNERESFTCLRACVLYAYSCDDDSGAELWGSVGVGRAGVYGIGSGTMVHKEKGGEAVDDGGGRKSREGRSLTRR